MDTTQADGADVVRRFFEAMQARDWDGAAALLHPRVRVWWPVTDERFAGADFLAMQRAYPDGWRIEVVETLGDGPPVSARVAVDLGGERYWCFGSYLLDAGAIVDGVELWGTQGSEQAPAWRDQFTS